MQEVREEVTQVESSEVREMDRNHAVDNDFEEMLSSNNQIVSFLSPTATDEEINCFEPINNFLNDLRRYIFHRAPELPQHLCYIDQSKEVHLEQIILKTTSALDYGSIHRVYTALLTTKLNEFRSQQTTKLKGLLQKKEFYEIKKEADLFKSIVPKIISCGRGRNKQISIEYLSTYAKQWFRFKIRELLREDKNCKQITGQVDWWNLLDEQQQKLTYVVKETSFKAEPFPPEYLRLPQTIVGQIRENLKKIFKITTPIIQQIITPNTIEENITRTETDSFFNDFDQESASTANASTSSTTNNSSTSNSNNCNSTPNASTLSTPTSNDLSMSNSNTSTATPLTPTSTTITNATSFLSGAVNSVPNIPTPSTTNAPSSSTLNTIITANALFGSTSNSNTILENDAIFDSILDDTTSSMNSDPNLVASSDTTSLQQTLIPSIITPLQPTLILSDMTPIITPIQPSSSLPNRSDTSSSQTEFNETKAFELMFPPKISCYSKTKNTATQKPLDWTNGNLQAATAPAIKSLMEDLGLNSKITNKSGYVGVLNKAYKRCQRDKVYLKNLYQVYEKKKSMGNGAAGTGSGSKPVAKKRRTDAGSVLSVANDLFGSSKKQTPRDVIEAFSEGNKKRRADGEVVLSTPWDMLEDVRDEEAVEKALLLKDRPTDDKLAAAYDYILTLMPK